MQFLILASLLGLSAAAAVPAAPTPEYVHGFPICNVSGFTEANGKYIQTTHQQPNATLLSCLTACREDSDCKSVSYAAEYTGCYFYNKFVQGTYLEQDDTSYFAHYDEVCGPYF